MGLTPLRRLQLAELEMAKKFVAFCDEHDLRYFMLDGTFLGAVRHKGFIPWDDDMDFGLLREDYERFLLLSEMKQVPFDVHNYFTSDSNMRRYFTKIEDPSIKVRRNAAKIEEITNIWIDIFPLDGMPNQSVLRKFREYYILWRRAAYRFSIFSINVDTQKPNRPLAEKLLIEFGKRFPVEKVFRFDREIKKLDKAVKKYPLTKSKWLFNAMSGYKFKEMFRKEIFGEGLFYEFEGQKWRGPQDFETYLTQLYGDYMSFPPESERNCHSISSISESNDRL